MKFWVLPNVYSEVTHFHVRCRSALLILILVALELFSTFRKQWPVLKKFLYENYYLYCQPIVCSMRISSMTSSSTTDLDVISFLTILLFFYHLQYPLPMASHQDSPGNRRPSCSPARRSLCVGFWRWPHRPPPTLSQSCAEDELDVTGPQYLVSCSNLGRRLGAARHGKSICKLCSRPHPGTVRPTLQISLFFFWFTKLYTLKHVYSTVLSETSPKGSLSAF